MASSNALESRPHLLAWLLVALSLYGSVALAMEMPAELMREGANLLKSAEYAMHKQFPLASDVEVELPLHVDDNMDGLDEVDMRERDERDEQRQRQQQLEQQLEQQHINANANANANNNRVKFIKLHQQHKQPSSGAAHGQGHVVHTIPTRHCSIEISSKIPGICQPMAPIGSACVSGDYMDLFNLECM